MDLPSALREALAQRAEGADRAELARAAREISVRYRTASGSGERLVTREIEALAYALARMPATCGAASAALEAALSAAAGFAPRTLLDVGAGTGAASWAAAERLALDGVVCLEREEAMRALGESLMRSGSDALRAARWTARDFAREAVPERAELVIASYALGELSEADRLAAAAKLWDAAEGMLLLIEPGTPEGFRQLRAARESLLARGARVAAPCPSEGPCPMAEGDWCHFGCRVARGRLHKALKGGDSPFEDEKFAYMAFARFPCERASARVLRHPYVEKGRITLYACSGDSVGPIVVTRKSAEAFRAARKAASGSALELGL